ncbi:Gfo/Idh/MocA family protein [Kitasatospora misakiensis]|uniref:Gfo/Idh/MocA family protein n=1 Tax=Kitasatospora misakiensis TaxID=67330 RepID=A0ABW0XDM1_9ACTN
MSTRIGRPRIAVVGGGGRIGGTHARNLLKLGADVTAVEPDPARAAALSAGLGCRVVPDAAELPDVDGVVVCTPTDTHEAVVAGLLPRGIPVLLEKPCTARPEASARLGALADEAGVPLRIGFQRRFSPEYAALRQEYRARSEEFGFAVFTSLDGAPPPQGYQVAGGSLAFDLQIHDIDLVLWLFGSEVVGVSASQGGAGAAADLLVTTLTLACGTVCSVVSKRASPAGCQAYAELIGSRTQLDTRPLTAPGPHPDFRSRFAAAYRAETAAFLAFVGGGPDELPHWRDAVAAETVCARIDEALSPAGAYAGASLG